MADLFYDSTRRPLNTIAPSLIPRVRIARVTADCLSGGQRAIPAYIEVKWWQWRWHAWLGPRTHADKNRLGGDKQP